jgi:hypothetical protein
MCLEKLESSISHITIFYTKPCNYFHIKQYRKAIIRLGMGKMIFTLDNDLDERFRKTIASVKGLHRGVIQEALEEAVQEWIKQKTKGAKK